MPDEYEKRMIRRYAVNKHDLVQEDSDRSQLEWNRAGFKKLEKTVVSGRYQNCEITIYFDRSDAMFGASLHGVTTMTRDYKLLVNKLCDIVREHESIVFTRYIEIAYERHHAAKITSLYGRSWGGHEREDRPVAGLRLDFHVYDVSDTFAMTYNDGKGKARVWRYIQPAPKKKQSHLKYTDDGWWILLEDTVNEDHRDDDKLIPYTPDRWRILNEIRIGLQTIDQRLQTIFGEKVGAQNMAALLDSFVGQKLLPPPTEKKGRKR